MIFYLPKTSDSTNRSAFWNVIDCCVTMMAAYKFVNLEMSKIGLPSVSYRISADYGKAIISKPNANSQTSDLFGPILDLCTKINSKAPPNGMVIGNNLYQILKSYLNSSSLSTSSFTDDYNFKIIGEYSIIGSKQQSYSLYSVISKYTNYNTATTIIAIQHADIENMLKLQKEKNKKTKESSN